MQVGLGVQQSGFANAHRINRSSMTRNGNSGQEQLSKAGRRDSVTISPGGKRNSMLEDLMKQKTNITDRKNSLISSTLENGGTLDTIKSQLENYDEQMKTIDDQIVEMMAKEIEKQTEGLKKQEDSKPKTEEEVQSDRLANITNLSSDLKQTQVISSVQARADGGARVLESEIALDKAHGGSAPGSKGLISKKEATLAGMQKRSRDLTSQISEKLSDIVEKISDSNRPQAIAPSEKPEADEVSSTEASSTDKQAPGDRPSAGVGEGGSPEKTTDGKAAAE